MTMEQLPFSRPTIGAEEQAAVRGVLASGLMSSGPQVDAFEHAFAEFLGDGVRVLTFGSGPQALEAALLASDVGPGDEVILPAMGFVACANVVLKTGARPRFVDVDPVSRNLSVAAVEAAIQPRTKAVIPAHFAGRPVELAPIYELGQATGLPVIEDASQAIGSRCADQPIGASGNLACFSFHPSKSITTIEGGALAFRGEQLARRLERIRCHGIEESPNGDISVPEWGGETEMSDAGAAMGLAQLAKLEGFIERRRLLARRYLEHLPDRETLLVPEDVPGHGWHMFCVCIDFPALGMSRWEFIAALRERGIDTGIHYPAVHLFGLYRRFGYGPGDFPEAERIGDLTLTLPLFPAMELEDVDRVCEAISELLGD